MKKEWNYKIFQKMEKTEIGPYFQFMASWPKKSNFEGVKIFLGPKIFLGYPILEFLTLKTPQKWYFSLKTKIGPQFQFTGSWPKKSKFEGVKIFLGTKIFFGYPILGFMTLKSTICFHQKHHKIGNISTCKFFDVFDENKSFFGTFKGQKY